jgi:hypothetical protein
MDDEAQHLGGQRGGGLYCRSFSLSQTVSESCEMLHLSGGTQPNTGSAAKWSCKRDVGKHCRDIKRRKLLTKQKIKKSRGNKGL